MSQNFRLGISNINAACNNTAPVQCLCVYVSSYVPTRITRRGVEVTNFRAERSHRQSGRVDVHGNHLLVPSLHGGKTKVYLLQCDNISFLACLHAPESVRQRNKDRSLSCSTFAAAVASGCSLSYIGRLTHTPHKHSKFAYHIRPGL